MQSLPDSDMKNNSAIVVNTSLSLQESRVNDGEYLRFVGLPHLVEILYAIVGFAAFVENTFILSILLQQQLRSKTGNIVSRLLINQLIVDALTGLVLFILKVYWYLIQIL